MGPRNSNFGQAVRFWRQTLGLSQEELALEIDISRKHLSFLETGKTSPSKELVFAIAEVLNLQERDENNLLVAAGFAPTAPPMPPDQFGTLWQEKALTIMLRGQDPKPCCVRDRYGYVKAVNRAWVKVYRDWLGDLIYEAPLNMHKLTYHEVSEAPRLENWDNFGWQSLLALKQELLLAPNAQAEALYEEITSLPAVKKALAEKKQLAPSGNVCTYQFVNKTGQIERWTVINTMFTEDQFTDARLIIDTWYPRGFVPPFTPEDLWADKSLRHPLLYY